MSEMHKIAVVKIVSTGYSSSYDYDISNSDAMQLAITEWEEVSVEDLQLLCNAARYGNFMVIEQRSVSHPDIITSVKKYIEAEKKRLADLEKEKQKREEAALQRKLKKEAKTKADKLKLFEKLKQEFGDNA